ncbi:MULTISPECIES: RNA recognition motif domain-containing protein [Photobacterium]|uniref:RNA-binding protein n=1 Tax=Photobacterium ganghwense TaxID=320778 RepID=A0A0J1H2V9_9GAMM|nr:MULTISPECIES: RNA-binding protein [Photobacterium]KLV06133.1 RNA-binding protein [Photobacterium ganghwense]MBV1840041.1 RNA-binding protein [Photobacterium ganghwense]PSU04933.1 RNA-binding protein [Photobacterium ganghwense]QSV13969.1 RNA-binding protein [Photobacterium ganghwense]
MKLSNQTLMPILAIAVVGGIIFSFLPFSSGIAFALGSICTAFILSVIPTSTSSPDDINQASKTLYVGNLPYRANESDVKDLFAEYGEVFAVRLMKDKRTGKRRGFGFVVMNIRDADQAVAALNNKEYGQRTLKVREANEPKNEDNPDF